MSKNLEWIKAELKKIERSQLLRRPKVRESPPVAGLVQIDGRQFINFGSNDYLGIAASKELVLKAQDVIGQVGFGSGASALVNGRGTLHRQLELELARFEKTESAILFPSGYAANVGTICSLVGKSDVVFSDRLNHASIIDGCRLSGAEVVVYPHSNMGQLEKSLQASADFRRRLIVTDGLFSMDGDFSRLPELGSLAEKYGAMLMVDEAHATGVLGTNGRGSCELLGVEDQVDVKVGTLSKALGGIGGFVAGTEALIDWIFNNARTLIFSTALPEIAAAAGLAALNIVRNDPERRSILLSQSEYLRNELKATGLAIGKSESQIVPVVFGESSATIAHQTALEACGYFVPAIRPPSVPEGSSRLRISLSADHTVQQIDGMIACLKHIKNQ